MTNLLLVDDEVGTLLAYRKLLESSNVHVDTAASIEEASRLLAKNHYDVVISDLRLTGTFGLEGLEIVRLAKNQNPQTMIILITAYGTAEAKNRAKQLGASMYLEKPVVAEDLRTVISTLGVTI